MGSEMGLNISGLKPGVNYGNNPLGKTTMIDKGFIEIVKLAAQKDGDTENLSSDEAQDAMNQLKAMGYNIDDDKNKFMSMLGVSKLDSEELTSSETDESTGITTNVYQTNEGKTKTRYIDKTGRVIGGIGTDGVEWSRTFDNENNSYTDTDEAQEITVIVDSETKETKDTIVKEKNSNNSSQSSAAKISVISTTETPNTLVGTYTEVVGNVTKTTKIFGTQKVEKNSDGSITFTTVPGTEREEVTITDANEETAPNNPQQQPPKNQHKRLH